MQTQGYYKHQRQQQQNSQTHNCELQQTQSRMERNTYKSGTSSSTSQQTQQQLFADNSNTATALRSIHNIFVVDSQFPEAQGQLATYQAAEAHI